jgi:16S rRNA (guanine(1405)-N(7))-methyltransferase
MSESGKDLNSLVEALASTTKYKNVSPELVRNIGARELAKGVSLKTAVKATKGKLHQVGGAYQAGQIDYDSALQSLRSAASPEAWRTNCRQIMSLHASTRERLSILEQFYQTVLTHIPSPHRVLDIACGLNPLAVSWMPLAGDVSYNAYDIYSDMMQFIGDFMQLAKLNGRAEMRDVIHNPPQETADLALLLKTLPCLEQIEKGVSSRLLDSIQARYLLISYPVSSLGGRQKGMVATYDAQFAALLEGRLWTVRRFLFSSELAFLVDTQGNESGNE